MLSNYGSPFCHGDAHSVITGEGGVVAGGKVEVDGVHVLICAPRVVHHLGKAHLIAHDLLLSVTFQNVFPIG